MAKPFVPTKLYTVSGNYVQTVEVPPFIKPMPILVWGSRLFLWTPEPGAPAGDPWLGQYLEAGGICIAWTEEEKKSLGIN